MCCSHGETVSSSWAAPEAGCKTRMRVRVAYLKCQENIGKVVRQETKAANKGCPIKPVITLDNRDLVPPGTKCDIVWQQKYLYTNAPVSHWLRLHLRGTHSLAFLVYWMVRQRGLGASRSPQGKKKKGVTGSLKSGTVSQSGRRWGMWAGSRAAAIDTDFLLTSETFLTYF